MHDASNHRSPFREGGVRCRAMWTVSLIPVPNHSVQGTEQAGAV